MKIEFLLHGESGSLKVIREQDDKKFYGFYGEGQFLHCLCKYLNQCGFALIKKLAWKDGHMMGDNHMHYLRPPKPAGKKQNFPHIYIYSGHYAIDGAHEHWNAGEETLLVAGNIYDKQPDWKQKICQLGKLNNFKVRSDASV